MLSVNVHEIEVNEEIVNKLIWEQFPVYKNMPLQRVHSMGTVNAIYRLGDELCVRLPLLDLPNRTLHNELKVLPIISKNVTMNVPEIIEMGKPSDLYPLTWAIYRWIKGITYNDSLTDEAESAKALAKFINEL